MRRWAATIGVVCVMALGAGACGGDGSDDENAAAELETRLASPASVLDADAGSATTTTVAGTVDVQQGYEHSEAALGGLGDDPVLDALALGCFHADLSACDDLYVGSPDGSLYEAYGATCGARLDAPTHRLCADVLVGDGEPPEGLGEDSFLDALAAQCYAGDLLDCDLLYAEADTGSQYEAYGASCGRRIDTEGDCVELVGAPLSR